MYSGLFCFLLVGESYPMVDISAGLSAYRMLKYVVNILGDLSTYSFVAGLLAVCILLITICSTWLMNAQVISCPSSSMLWKIAVGEYDVR